MEINSRAGLILAAAFIRYDMEKTPPLLPVDDGILRNSWGVIPVKLPGKFGLLIGFSANYAVFVHEMRDDGKSINWSRPGSGPKFFEAALNRNHQQILTIIQKKVWVPGSKKRK